MFITALELLHAYRLWVYGALGLLLLWQLVDYARHRHTYVRSTFNFVRQLAAGAMSRAATIAVIVLLLAALVFINSTYVNPNIPAVFGVSPTPTATVPTTPTPTPTNPVVIPGLTTPTPEASLTPLPSATPVPLGGAGCSDPSATIRSPLPGAVLGGQVEVIGTADIPDFAFYVMEISTLGENWLTVYTGTVPVSNDVLGVWNADLQPPGDYAFRLAVVNANGDGPAPCTIPISIGT